MKTPNPIFQNIIIPLLLISFSVNSYSQQQHFGDLELTVLGIDGIPAKAIDPDLQDTTIVLIQNSIAYFEDLYIYTSVGIHENEQSPIPSLEGEVKFYDIQGNLLGVEQANANGTVFWDGLEKTAKAGIYLLQDEKGNSIKFIYLNRPCLLGKINTMHEANGIKSLQNNSNIYEIWVDGRILEWDPFDLVIEEHELFADIVNYVILMFNTVPDAPATGQVEILVDGESAGNGSQVKIVETGTTDTTYLITTDRKSVV